MAYATIDDVQSRMNRELTEAEITLCESMLADAAVIVDSYNKQASDEAKLVVSCRMVARMLGDGESDGYPMGASQGSISGLGYSQSWTMGSGGATGELYISKLERKLLGVGNRIGAYSPVQDLAEEVTL